MLKTTGLKPKSSETFSKNVKESPLQCRHYRDCAFATSQPQKDRATKPAAK